MTTVINGVPYYMTNADIAAFSRASPFNNYCETSPVDKGPLAATYGDIVVTGYTCTAGGE